MIEICRELIDRNIRAIFTKDVFTTYLQFMSSFITFPYENQILLFCQNNEISKVSSYYAWNKLNRNLKENPEALTIIFPTYRNEKMFLTMGYVFDVSQTEGEEVREDEYNFKYLNLIRNYTELTIMTESSVKNNYLIDYENNELCISEDLEETTLNMTYLLAFIEYVCAVEVINYPGCKEYINYIEQMIKYILLYKLGFSTNKFTFPYINKLGEEFDINSLKLILNTVQFFSNSIWENLAGTHLTFYETAILNSLSPLPETKEELICSLGIIKNEIEDVSLINAVDSLFNKFSNIPLDDYQKFFKKSDFILSFPSVRFSQLDYFLEI